MRTTIMLDDGLAAELKRRARTEGKSVSAIISDALRAHLSKRQTPPKTAPFRLVTVKGGGLRPRVDVAKLRTVEEIEDVARWKRHRR
jgi:plasmid stability protein